MRTSVECAVVAHPAGEVFAYKVIIIDRSTSEAAARESLDQRFFYGVDNEREKRKQKYSK